MESRVLCRENGSSGRGSSSIWRRNRDADVFSRSYRQQDDDEALKWAALEKLPTYDRLRKGILTTSSGEANEVDIEKLGLQERNILLGRLVKEAEEDHEKILLKLKRRIDRLTLNIKPDPDIDVFMKVKKAFSSWKEILHLVDEGVVNYYEQDQFHSLC